MSGLRYEKGVELYIASVPSGWDSLWSPLAGASDKIQGTKAVGFTLVFDSYEDCKAEYPNHEPMRVIVVGKDGVTA